MRSIAIKLTFAATATLFAAASANADDGRRHVVTAAQQIDMVRDLPDIAAFEKDGVYFDLGYIYPIHTVNGASVAGGDGESGYVLYNGDRYVRADSSTMHDLEYVLGDDPTQGYTPPKTSATSAADPWGANGTAAAATGDETVASPAARRASGGRSIGIVGTFFLFFLVLFIRVRLFRDMVVGGVLAGIAAIVRRRAAPEFATDAGIARERRSTEAAAQRARLDALAATPVASSGGGGFGRKGV